MTIARASKNLLRRADFKVYLTQPKGEEVTLQIGNACLNIHYEDALQLSQWIRFWAKEAKNNAGDKSRHWSAIGLLTDAEMSAK